MEIRQVSDSVAIYSDGQRLQVIHDLGDEFVLDFSYRLEPLLNIDNLTQDIVASIAPVFRVSGYCSRAGEAMYRLKRAIRQFEIFEQYLNDNQVDLLDWYKNPEGDRND